MSGRGRWTASPGRSPIRTCRGRPCPRRCATAIPGMWSGGWTGCRWRRLPPGRGPGRERAAGRDTGRGLQPGAGRAAVHDDPGGSGGDGRQGGAARFRRRHPGVGAALVGHVHDVLRQRQPLQAGHRPRSDRRHRPRARAGTGPPRRCGGGELPYRLTGPAGSRLRAGVRRQSRGRVLLDHRVRRWRGCRAAGLRLRRPGRRRTDERHGRGGRRPGEGRCGAGRRTDRQGRRDRCPRGAGGPGPDRTRLPGGGRSAVQPAGLPGEPGPGLPGDRPAARADGQSPSLHRPLRDAALP